MKVFELEDGKYKIYRDDNGLITNVERNGELWPMGLANFQFNKCFHAALNRIEDLENEVTGLQVEVNYLSPEGE